MYGSSLKETKDAVEVDRTWKSAHAHLKKLGYTQPNLEGLRDLDKKPVFELADPVNHPDHYGGKDNPYEARKVIRAWGLGFNLGNVVKYISRAGKKDPNKHIEDLKKAVFYLQDEISFLDAEKQEPSLRNSGAQ